MRKRTQSDPRLSVATSPVLGWLRSLVLPAIALAVLLLVTLLTWRRVEALDFELARNHFSADVDGLVALIVHRITTAEVAMRSATGVFAAQPDATREQWRLFVDSVQLRRFHPGVQGLGFARRVPADQLESHVAALRAEGIPLYTVRTHSGTADLVPIVYLEPADWRNYGALGLDMYAEPARRAAIEMARDTGNAALSAPVALLNNLPTTTPTGVLMYLPVYRGSTVPQTMEERRRAWAGVIFSPFRMSQFIAAALRDKSATFGVAIVDVTSGETPLFRNFGADQRSRFAGSRVVDVGGRRWRIDVMPTPQHEGQLAAGQAPRVLAYGLAVTLLFTGWAAFYSIKQERVRQQEARLTEELRQREERFRLLIEGAPNAMIMIDASGQIELCNAQAEALFGYHREELIGRSIELLLPERYRGVHVEWRRQYQEQPVPRRTGSGRELHARRRDGSEVPVEIGLSPVQTDSGWKTISSIIDLTERRRAEERFRLVVEASPNAIVLVDTDGKIQLVNSRTEQLLGYSQAELIGQSVEILVPDAVRGRHGQLRAAYVQQPSQRQMGGHRDLYARHKHGQEIPVEVGLAPIRAGGVLLIQAVIIDITARKAVERRLREQAEQLAVASRYKSEFLANMSHELRTPLNSILVLSEQLKGPGQDNLTARQRTHAEIIYRSGNELLQLINDILDLSKIEAGRMTLVLEPVSVRDLASTLQAAMLPLADAKDLDFIVDIAPEVPPSCYTDYQRLHQVLKNLLANAIKFTDQGSVTLRVRLIDETGEASSALEVSVEDTGIGIPSDKCEVIFQAFQQADGSTSRRYGGSGLGLTIARQLVELLGGTIRVESELGQGSVFSVRLPLGETQQETAAATELQISGPRGNPRILVLEENAGSDVVAATCNQFQFTTYTIGTLQGAEDLLHRQSFVGVIVIGGGDVGGAWRLLTTVRADPACTGLPIHLVLKPAHFNQWSTDHTAYLAIGPEIEVMERLLAGVPRPTLAKGLLRVLVVARTETAAFYRSRLTTLGCQVKTSGESAVALARLRVEAFDLIVVALEREDAGRFAMLRALSLPLPGVAPALWVHTGIDPTVEGVQEGAGFSAVVVASGGRDAVGVAVVPFMSRLTERELAAQQPEPSLPRPDFQGRRVLLVDDDVRNIYAVGSVLEGFGLEVLTARDGEEALRQAARHQVDLVLMDMAMPVMDGYTAIRALKQDHGVQVPVVAITAHAMRGDRERCLEAGADDYLAKPVTEQELLATLKKWCDVNEVHDHVDDAARSA